MKSNKTNNKLKKINKSELIKVTYHLGDEEREEIVIDNKESFDIYLCHTLGLSPHHLHVREWNGDTQTVKTVSKSYNSIEHDQIECDGCYISPIVGHRYTCIQCINYDLCQNCALDKIHMKHSMLQISVNNCSRADETNVSNNASEEEESSSSWEDVSDVSSDEDKNAKPNSCRNSKYHKTLWSTTKDEKEMWTTDESSDEDSESSSWKTIDSSDEESYDSDMWTTEESSDEEESDDDNPNCRNKHKNEMSTSSEWETGDSSDGETNSIESVNDNPICSETNTENVDTDDEYNNLMASFIII
ncbi:hypothetical protein DOY81_000454 [Sarcophaga bullata]|nr:hypothetical protein DOY81_000454 [Sarcophaga bullata]